MLNIWNLAVPGGGARDKLALMDDFLQYSGSTTAGASAWLETEVGTSAAIVASDAVIGGAVSITSGSTAGETGIDTNGGGFSIPATGKLYFECRFKVADADITLGEVFVGLGSIADVAPIAGDTNKIGFSRKTADATLWHTTGDTLTSAGKDLSDDDFVTVAFAVNNGKAYYYVDLEDGNGPSLVGTTTTLATTSTVLSPKVFVGDSAANAQIVTVDYILVVQDVQST
jgi:hypothetical protein